MKGTLVHRKESIILTSVEGIDPSGFQGFSTRGVSQRPGISEETLYKRFRSKSEWMIAMLEHYLLPVGGCKKSHSIGFATPRAEPYERPAKKNRYVFHSLLYNSDVIAFMR